MPTITVDGVNIHYLDAGTGQPTVVLLHAFPFHSGMWEQQIEALSDRYRVIAPDLKGFGRSGAPEEITAYSMTSYAREVAEVVDLAGADQFVLVGLSMGGYVAFSLLRSHRDRVVALVLADTRAGADSPEVLERRSRQQSQIEQGGTGPVIDAMLGTLFSEYTRENQPEVLERARELMDNPDAAFIGALEAMKARSDVTSELEAIEVPTLILVGEDDRPSPPEIAESMHERIPESHLVVLPRAGHLSNLEVPDEFNQALLDFLKSL